MENMRSRKAAEEAVKVLFKKIERVIGEASYITLDQDVMKIDFDTVGNYTGDYATTSENPLIDANADCLYTIGLEFFAKIKDICNSNHMSVIAEKKDSSYRLSVYAGKEIPDAELPSEVTMQIEKICDDLSEGEVFYYKEVPSDITYFGDGKISLNIVPLTVYEKGQTVPAGIGVSTYLENLEQFKDTHFLSLNTGDDLEFSLKAEENDTLDFFENHIGNCDTLSLYMKIDEETGETSLNNTVYKRFEHTF